MTTRKLEPLSKSKQAKTRTLQINKSLITSWAVQILGMQLSELKGMYLRITTERRYAKAFLIPPEEYHQRRTKMNQIA